MGWLLRYRIKLYIRNSIWFFPALSIVAGLVTVALLTRYERAQGWEMKVSRETARAIMGTVAASMFSLVVLVSSAILVAVQLASAQLTPRIIAMIYRNPVRKFVLAVFVFTFTFSVGLLVRLEGGMPLLTSYIAAYGFLFNLALFLYFIDSMGKTLRPSSALRTVAQLEREVIRTVYQRRLDKHMSGPPAPIRNLETKPGRIVLNTVDGVLLAFDMKGLVSLAEQSNCLIELIPQVGDFVAAGDPLFRIFQGEEFMADDRLRNSVALGAERAAEQDPLFAFRIIVDIASKALSPAVNDPTTAVLAIDQIHHLLRDVGNRYLAQGWETDRTGQLRLVYRTPSWDSFVHLAITEVRQYGRDSMQVTRRLRAMLENLIETLPDRRTPLLYRELNLLEGAAKRAFPEPEDQTLAEIGDSQGIGGSRGDLRPGEPLQSDGVGPIPSRSSGAA
jgi:uncharacterized membrane protein